MRRLSALDAGFLALETDLAPLHVGALLLLDGPVPDEDLLRAELLRRVSTVAACHQRVRRTRGGLLRPTWVDDPDPRPIRHLHVATVDPPGDRAALRRLVVELMGVRLDTSRPLWEVWCIGGLADGGWGLLVTAHHTLVDGVAGATLLAALLTAESGVAQGPTHRTSRCPVPPVRERLNRARQGIRTVAVPDLPPNVLNGPLGDRRTWDWITLDLADLDAVADGAGCTVNDVYLTALAGGVRAVLSGRGALGPDTRVRVIVPVSMRTGAGEARTGNIDAALFVELPVHLESARAMLVDVAAQTACAKADGVPLATEALLRLGDLVPACVLDRAARAYVRRGQARVNLAASDVRGPGTPLVLCERPVREVVPCVPLALDVRTTSALFSYAGLVSLSVTVDSGAGADADVLVAAIATTLAELRTG
jgi:diacylglycerol O-acyltransferase / wax synthase